MNKIIITIRILLISCFLVLLIFLFNKHYGIFSNVSIDIDFPIKDKVLNYSISPAGRIINMNNYIELKGDPVYFDFKLPSYSFEKIKLAIEYKNPDYNFIEFGVKRGPKDWQIDLFPMFNDKLERLKNDKNWFSLTSEDGKIILFQRKNKKIFSNIKNFLNSNIDIMKIASYNIKPFFKQSFPKQYKKFVYNIPLRGRHTILVYVNNKKLDLNLFLQNIDRHKGKDDVIVRVYNMNNNKELFSKLLQDRDLKEQEQELNIQLSNLEEGIYKVVINANDDTFIKKLETTNQKLVFENRVYLAGNSEYSKEIKSLSISSTILFTNIKKLTFYTSHGQGLQKIKINNKEELNIDVVHKKYDFIIKSKYFNPQMYLNKLYFPKNDIKIQGRGYFSFSPEAFFYPYPRDLGNVNTDKDGIDYVIAKYEVVKKIPNNILLANYYFNINNLYLSEDRKLRFIFSLPISSKKSVKIYKIHLELIKSDKLSKILRAFKKELYDTYKKFKKYN